MAEVIYFKQTHSDSPTEYLKGSLVKTLVIKERIGWPWNRRTVTKKNYLVDVKGKYYLVMYWEVIN